MNEGPFSGTGQEALQHAMFATIPYSSFKSLVAEKQVIRCSIAAEEITGESRTDLRRFPASRFLRPNRRLRLPHLLLPRAVIKIFYSVLFESKIHVSCKT